MSWVKAKHAIADVLAAIVIETNKVANPSAETDTSGIVATGASVAVDAAQFKFGAQSLRVTGSPGSTDKVEWRWDLANLKAPVIAGEPYTFAVYAKPAVGTTVTAQLGVDWYDGEPGTLIGTTSLGGAGSVASGADWARKLFETVAPAGAVTASPFWKESTASFGAGEIVYFDGAMFNVGYERPYFDGTSPGCVWDGTAHVSTSIRIVKRVYEDPPGTIQDHPCFIITPPPVENEVMMGQRWRKYEAPVQCFVSDQDKDQAAALIDLTREALIPAFDGSVSLEGGATMAYVKSCGPGVGLEYPRGSGKVYAGFEAVIFVEIKEAVDFAA